MSKLLIVAGLIMVFNLSTVIPSFADDGLIYGCIQKKVGKMRVVDNPSDCRKSEIAIFFNKVGPQGEQGLQGPIGPQGEPGPQGPPGPVDGYSLDADDGDPVDALYVNNEGYVGIGTIYPQAKLDVAGAIRIQGADVAEQFPVSENVKPGMVLAIDPENPGKLRLARSAYNTRVAGIVSGANGLSAGAVLGNMPGMADDPAIALSGRVWCFVDAESGGPVNPGDMLTTSDIPGYAMKVTDHSRAQGAILGKAMTKLEDGRDLVLVLVSLQ